MFKMTKLLSMVEEQQQIKIYWTEIYVIVL